MVEVFIMANALHTADANLWQKHQANVVASLNHRLEVARANQDTRLIALLEQEQQQIAANSDRRSGSLRDQLSGLWDDFLALIRGDSSLRVWQSVDDHGYQWWCAYNPQTGQSLYTDSETEMRIWIEQNYSEVRA